MRLNCPGASRFNFGTTRREQPHSSRRSVGELTDELRNIVHESDVVLFDGTFWSDGELARYSAGRPQRATDESSAHQRREPRFLASIAGAPEDLHAHKQYEPDSYARLPGTRPLEQAGIEIARDGLEILI